MSNQPTTPGGITVNEISPNDLKDPALSLLNTNFQRLAGMIQYLLGLKGTIMLSADVDMQGHNIHHLGTPTDINDALSQASADPLYGSAVQALNMSAVGKQMIATTRQLNNRNQREKYSTFLNGTMSTPPGSSGALVSFTVIDGTHTQITISADQSQLADQSTIPFASRSDTVVNPTSYTIAAAPTGAVRNNGTATITTTTNHSFVVGQYANVNVTGDPSFNGNFVVLTVPSATQITYANPGPNTTSGGGTLSLGGVYYYYLRSTDKTLQMVGPFLSDTPQNRIAANFDGQQFIAVAVVTSSGGNPSVSGGGGNTIGQGGAKFV